MTLMVRDLIAGQLQSLGYSVVTAFDANDALQRLTTEHKSFDLVITDVMMPGGINGYWELGQKIRRTRPHIPVLFVTGFSEDAPIMNNIAVADFHLLRKPFGRSAN